MAVAGLTPISPTIKVVPVVEIPVFARITKSSADPRSTVSVLALAMGMAVAAIESMSIVIMSVDIVFLFSSFIFTFIFSFVRRVQGFEW